jgi:DNA-binding GntR family transcriptional regulator
MTKATTQDTAKRKPKGYSAIVIYETIRDEILSLTLQPCQLIDEVSIAKRFNVSRSPVREAMVRLVSESLLQTLPNKGTIVTPLRIEEFSQYVDALDLVQRTVTRLAAKFRNEASLQLIREEQVKFNLSVAQNDAMKMILSNRDFHLAIAKAGNNSYFENIYRRLLDDGRRSLRLYFKSFDDHLPSKMVDNHQAMIDAIEAQDVNLAERLAHEHTLEMQQQFLKYLGSRNTSNIIISL